MKINFTLNDESIRGIILLLTYELCKLCSIFIQIYAMIWYDGLLWWFITSDKILLYNYSFWIIIEGNWKLNGFDAPLNSHTNDTQGGGKTFILQIIITQNKRE